MKDKLMSCYKKYNQLKKSSTIDKLKNLKSNRLHILHKYWLHYKVGILKCYLSIINNYHQQDNNHFDNQYTLNLNDHKVGMLKMF
jgi:hypothetical protein